MTGGGAFFDQFIEDYFAECDEHLAAARRVLLALEEDARRGEAPDARQLRDLFRSLHTLKGLSGMVGNAAAERLAHALEGSLRSAERTGAPLAPALMDTLFPATDLLERCVESRRGGTPPDIEGTVATLARLASATTAAEQAPGGTTATTTPPAAAPAPAPASDTGAVVHRFAFTPSLALTARGVGVDAVRARLRELGTILDAKPRIVTGGVTFDFRVAVPAGRAIDAAWAADGLQWAVEGAADPAAQSTAEGAVPPPNAAGSATSPSTMSAGSAGAAPGVGDASSAASGNAGAAGGSLVRVDLARIDGVMRLVGDLVVSRSRLDDVARHAMAGDLAAVVEALDETNAAMERQLRRLRESVMRIRLVPVGEVFERLRFAARDAIRESGKQVALTFHGQATEIDKLVVDRMLEPLLHLVRNAVSHGIETPEVRRARGKPAEGALTLRAAAAGDRIRVDVEDDGAGIELESVAGRARARGLLAPGQSLAPEQLLDVLCAPGFSTRDESDMTSGRGIGMDVVRATVRALAGELSLETRPGQGTRFVIELPLTLMILDALLVQIGDQQMAVPQQALREILQVDAATVVAFENNDVIPYRGGVLPLLGLARLFGIAQPRGAGFHALVVGSEAQPVGLVVDRLVGLREIVVHPVTDPLVALPGIAGATELGDGRVSLILDTAALLRMAQERRDRRAWAPEAATPPVAGRTPHLPA